jgi:hypothetical protein
MGRLGTRALLGRVIEKQTIASHRIVNGNNVNQVRSRTKSRVSRVSGTIEVIDVWSFQQPHLVDVLGDL